MADILTPLLAVPRILLLLDHRENRRLLAEWLARRYEVALPEAEPGLDRPFDLCIVDGPALSRALESILARKEAAQPLFLPVLLLTSREEVGLATRQLWQSVDELLVRPIQQRELQARVESLLRLRRLSAELAEALAAQRAANDQLERISRAKSDFVSVVSHEFRTGLAGIQGLSEIMCDDELSSHEVKEFAAGIFMAT